MTPTTTAYDAAHPPKRIPWDGVPGGRKIRLRAIQQIIWQAITGTLGTWVIAALYYLILQAQYGTFWLKPGWDGLINTGWWTPVRHDIRDVMEGVLATFFAKSLNANWHKHGVARKEVSGWRVATAPLLLLAIGLPLSFGLAWLLNVGGPAAWHHLLGHQVLHSPVHMTSWPAWLATFVGQYNWQPLVIGIALGFVIHPLFAPVGATIQDFLADLATSRAQRRHAMPAWTRWPVVPALRERVSWNVIVNDQPPERGAGVRAALYGTVGILTVLMAYGGYIKLWFAKHGIPGHLF